MKIFIFDTNEIKTLTLIDPRGDDHASEFIGNLDGLYGGDPVTSIEVLDQDGIDADYVTCADNYNWWADIIAKTQEANDLIYNYKEIITEDIEDELAEAYADAPDGTAERRLEIIKRAIDQYYEQQID